MGLFSVRHRGWDLRSYLRQISGICQHEVWTCVNDRGHWAFLGSVLIPFFSASKGQFKAGYMGEALITSKIFCTSHPKKTSWNLGIRRSAEIQNIEALSLKSPRFQNDDLFRVSPQEMDHPWTLTITHVTQRPVPPKSDDNHDKGFPLQKAWKTQQQFYQNTWETLWLGGTWRSLWLPHCVQVLRPLVLHVMVTTSSNPSNSWDVQTLGACLSSCRSCFFIVVDVVVVDFGGQRTLSQNPPDESWNMFGIPCISRTPGW